MDGPATTKPSTGPPSLPRRTPPSRDGEEYADYSVLLGNGCGEGLSPPSSVLGPTSHGCGVHRIPSGILFHGADGAEDTASSTDKKPVQLRAPPPPPPALLGKEEAVPSTQNQQHHENQQHQPQPHQHQQQHEGKSRKGRECSVANSEFAHSALKTIANRACSAEAIAQYSTANASVTAAAPTAAATAAATIEERKPRGGETANVLQYLAPLYELAIGEIISECERRVVNAPLGTTAAAATAAAAAGNTNNNNNNSNNNAPSASPFSETLRPSHASHGSPTGVTPGGARRLHVTTRSFDSPVVSGAAGASPLHSVLSFPSVCSDGAASTKGPASQVTGHEGEALFSRYLSSPVSRRESFVQLLLESLGRQLPFGESAPMVFVGALAYLSRVVCRSAATDGGVTGANWYRLTTTAILISSKMYFDQCSSRLNAHFAHAAGLTRAEMNRLELDFLYLIDFSLIIEEAHVERWLLWMEALAVRHGMMAQLRSFVFGAGPVSRVASASSVSTPAWDDTDDGATSLCTGSLMVATGAAAAETAAAAAAAAAVSRVPQSAAPGGEGRLFSVIYGAKEPTTPISIRELSRTGPAPMEPEPPSAPLRSPSVFFKRGGGGGGGAPPLPPPHPHDRQHQAAAARLSPPPPPSPTRGGKLASPTQRRPSAPAAAAGGHTEADTRSRWNSLGLVQRMRDVLDVTRSIFRGQLNILSPHRTDDEAEYEEEAVEGDGHGRGSATAGSPGRAQQQQQQLPRAEVPQRRTPPSAGGGRGVSTPDGNHHQQQQQCEESEELGYYDDDGHYHYYEDEGYYDEEGYYHYYQDEGYYDEEGYYHYYQDEGYYDDRGLYHYYSEEEADEGPCFDDEQETTPRRPCPPPLTHSPPDL